MQRRKAAAVAAAVMVGVAAACGFAAPLDGATIAGPGALTIVTVEVAAADDVRNPTQPALDSDGFPAITDDTLGTLFVTDRGVIYHCELIESLRMIGWRQVGRMRR